VRKSTYVEALINRSIFGQPSTPRKTTPTSAASSTSTSTSTAQSGSDMAASPASGAPVCIPVVVRISERKPELKAELIILRDLASTGKFVTVYDILDKRSFSQKVNESLADFAHNVYALSMYGRHCPLSDYLSKHRSNLTMWHLKNLAAQMVDIVYAMQCEGYAWLSIDLSSFVVEEAESYAVTGSGSIANPMLMTHSSPSLTPTPKGPFQATAAADLALVSLPASAPSPLWEASITESFPSSPTSSSSLSKLSLDSEPSDEERMHCPVLKGYIVQGAVRASQPLSQSTISVECSSGNLMAHIAPEFAHYLRFFEASNIQFDEYNIDCVEAEGWSVGRPTAFELYSATAWSLGIVLMKLFHPNGESIYDTMDSSPGDGVWPSSLSSESHRDHAFDSDYRELNDQVLAFVSNISFRSVRSYIALNFPGKRYTEVRRLLGDVVVPDPYRRLNINYLRSLPFLKVN